MEYRKIIEFGKSSYVVSLPKDWMNSNGIKKGDTVHMDHERSKLCIYPSTDCEKNKEPRRITIDATNMTIPEVRLRLISNYIRNFNEITITATNMKSKAKDIRAIVHDLMALEVIEENGSKIVTKDFMSMDDISPITIIQKMDNITREMVADSKGMLKEDRYESITQRDADVNRLCYLLFRTMKYLQNNPATATKHGLKQDKFQAVWAAAVKIETVADQAKWAAKIIKNIKFKESEKDDLHKLYSAVERYYLDSMEAFYKEDAEAAFALVVKSKRKIKQCRDFYRQNWNYERVASLMEKLQSIIGETKAMLTYVCDLER